MQRTFEDIATLSTATTESSEETLTRQVVMLVEMLQAQAGGPQGFRLRRIILTNFWLYGRQEFEIPHGRLFLAGENASGKSTVLTAALPLALDGDLRPNRLDTFGGRERHIEYYVLGGAESATPFNHERRTSYIALEFEWCDPDSPPISPELHRLWEKGDRDRARFLTIGLSIAGNVNSADRIRPLRFLITDGSRLGHDFDTIYATGHKNEMRACDHPRFKQLLEGHGMICETQADYERQVARHLFGFSEVKDFEKLVNLLLVLRRPNLSSELNFSRVHEYLKQSLRKISGETTSRVIGTIERIDAIQSEIERIREAFEATERVHRSRQHLALARSQLAACEYAGAQLAEDALEVRLMKLLKDLHAVNDEWKKAEALTQSLQTEQQQVQGQIKALESSKGVQIAQQLTIVREREQATKAQMQLQEQNLRASRQAVDANAASLDRQRGRFEQMKAESIAQTQELRSLAADEVLWEVAALQLQEAQEQMSHLSIEMAAAPQIPLGVSGLLDESAEERMAWLRRLEELHQQREKLETRVQYARTNETTRFQELDEARHHFQAAQDRGYDAQQNLTRTLEQFSTGDEFIASSYNIEVLMPVPGDITDDETQAGRAVEQFAAALAGYRQVIDTLESALNEAIDQVQDEMHELHLHTGRKMREVDEIKAQYEQKLAEPEYTPPRSPRRITARAKLAEQGIAALPLYALLDFAPGITDDEAGRIECTLEDAGLLDALVVAPSQVAAANALLTAEGLSDCRLDLSAMNGNKPSATGISQWLRFDPSAAETSSGSRQNDWAELATTVLSVIGARTSNSFRYSMNEDGSWTHGLLTGRAGSSTARCIGKETRLRARQRELDALNKQRTQRESELQWLTTRLGQYEQRLTRLQVQQVQLRKMLPESGIEEIYAVLSQARIALDNTRGKYQKARQQTQEARQQLNTLVATLERESQGIAQFASDASSIQHALMGMLRLKNQARTLQSQLASLIHTWGECQKAQEALEQAKANESNVARLYEHVRQQALQAQAEVEELQRVAASSDVEELSERLRTLRARNEALAGELDEAKTNYTRLDERAQNAEAHVAEVEASLQKVQEDRGDKQAHFVDLLTAYPVEDLAQVQQLATSGDCIGVAWQLLGGTLREGDIAARKEALEEAYRDTYNALTLTFNREQPLLHEYGPDMDAHGHVLFLNENNVSPVELLAVLGERIEMQRTLLGQEERRLFEDFLLQEMAEAIRTHILEAEEWVQQINGVLGNLPMIGEHYALQWKPLGEFDETRLGSRLAQHYRLLRKPAQALTEEETETLMGAFRREIEAVRIRQQENPGTNFLESLEQIFDYREWFHFEVWVTPIGGQRQRLTDRVAGTRSGAEQLFALYIPLFAALGALYRSAVPGAPRLLALDEAFDKVSAANAQRIMEFLVSQDFQWIMTGPQISGAGSKIPACARYLMIHEKGSLLATASASFWSDNQSVRQK
jgi:uncharacterized protein (TIGR02680 family)